MEFPSVMPSVITLEISDGFIPSVMFPRETFFLARAYLSVRPSVCPSLGVFFICDRLSDGKRDLPTTVIPTDVFRR